MKKMLFLRSVATVLVALLVLPFQALAETNTAADIMPDNASMYVDVDLNSLPASLVDPIISSLTSKISASANESGEVDKKSLAKLFTDILATKRLYVFMKIPPSDEEVEPKTQMAFIFSITDAQWQQLLVLRPKAEKQTFGTHTYYADTDDMNFAHIKNYLVLAPNASLEPLFASYDKGTFLATSSAYANTMLKLSPGNFLSYFLDIGDMMRESGALQTLSDIDSESVSGKTSAAILDFYKNLKQVAVGIQRSDNGVRIESVIAKSADLSQYSSSPFTPSLYAYAPAKNPLLYYEGYNLKKSIETAYSLMVNALSKGESVDTDSLDLVSSVVKTYLGFDYNKDLAPLLTKGYSLTVENGTGTGITGIVPVMTFMADARGNEDTARTMLKNIYTKVLALTAKSKSSKLKIEGPSIPGGSDFTLIIKMPASIHSELSSNDSPLVSKIKFDVTQDGMLLISTDPSITQTYGMGLDTSAFGASLTNSHTTALLSMDLHGITTLVKKVFTLRHQNLPESDRKFVDLTPMLQHIDTIAAPWSKIVLTGSDDGASLLSQMQVLFGKEVFTSDYWMSVVKASRDFSQDESRYARVKDQFVDVPQDAWYTDDVKQLKAQGIIHGYTNDDFDSVFRPDQHVTRAEFLSMLHHGFYDKTSSLDNTIQQELDSSALLSLEENALDQGKDFGFKDVDPEAWYSTIINLDAGRGLVKGFQDNTFRPNAEITRAEAVSMIKHFYDYNNNTGFVVDLPFREDRKFGDVPNNASFSEAVHLAYTLSIINGNAKGNFEPNRSLNRAEAARMINQLLRKKFEEELQ